MYNNYKSINPYAKNSKLALFGGLMLLTGCIFTTLLLSKAVPSENLVSQLSYHMEGMSAVLMIIMGTLFLFIGIHSSWSNRFLIFEKGDVIVDKGAEDWELEKSAMEILSVGKNAYGAIDMKGEVQTVTFLLQRHYKITDKVKVPKGKVFNG